MAGHYPHFLPSHSSPNQLATRVTLPFMAIHGRVEAPLRGFRNFVKRGHGKTTSWRVHGILADRYRQLWLSPYAYRQYRVDGV
jgi:hypothetical protein